MKKLMNRKGFTLVELLIVIAVLGIIAGIGVNTMGGVTDTFKTKADVETARMIARQIEIKVLAGEANISDGLTADECLTAFGEDAYPIPQKGGVFSFTVTDAGVVTVTANGVTIASAAATDANITIATEAIK